MTSMLPYGNVAMGSPGYITSGSDFSWSGSHSPTITWQDTTSAATYTSVDTILNAT